MKRSLAAAVFAAVLTATSARAEILEVFRASRHGAVAWAGDNMRVERRGRKLSFTEVNASGPYADAYTVRRFPYFRDGIVSIDVHQVVAGQYVFQALGLASGVHVATADLVPSTVEAGRRRVRLGDFYMPKTVDEVIFKLWVELEEGASITVSDVEYTIPIRDDAVVLDERFREALLWTADNLEVRPVGARAAIVLSEGSDLGSMLYPERYSISEIGDLVVSILAAQNGAVSVQLPVFDETGLYLDSVDVFRDVGVGVHARKLTDVKWPYGADSFLVKIWLYGDGAGAVVDRVLLAKEIEEEPAKKAPAEMADGDPPKPAGP